jgi:hypothetical protein
MAGRQPNEKSSSPPWTPALTHRVPKLPPPNAAEGVTLPAPLRVNIWITPPIASEP